MCLNIGTPKNINFSFETNGKLISLGVPILKHFRVKLLNVQVSISELSIQLKIREEPKQVSTDSRIPPTKATDL